MRSARTRLRAYPRTRQLPQEHSSLPPFRGEVRWGWDVANVYRRSFAPHSPTLRLDRRAAHLIHRHSGAFLSSFLRPLPSFLSAQEWGRLRFFPSFLRRQERGGRAGAASGGWCTARCLPPPT